MMSVAHSYDQVAKIYDSLYDKKIFKVEEKLIFKDIRKLIEPDHRILELGCGTGLSLEYLINYISPTNYMGVDISRKMLDVAEKKFPEYMFFQMDANCFQTDIQFDLIFATFGVMSYCHLNMTLSKMMFALRHGGKFFLMFHGDRNQNRVNTIWNTESVLKEVEAPQRNTYRVKTLKKNFDLFPVKYNIRGISIANGKIESELYQMFEYRTLSRILKNLNYHIIVEGTKL